MRCCQHVPRQHRTALELAIQTTVAREGAIAQEPRGAVACAKALPPCCEAFDAIISRLFIVASDSIFFLLSAFCFLLSFYFLSSFFLLLSSFFLLLASFFLLPSSFFLLLSSFSCGVIFFVWQRWREGSDHQLHRHGPRPDRGQLHPLQHGIVSLRPLLFLFLDIVSLRPLLVFRFCRC